MTKRRVLKQRRRVSPPNSGMTKTVLVPFRDVTTIQRSASAGYETSTINLNIPSFAAGSRVRSVAALYEYYRFRNLRVRAISDTSAVTTATSTNSYLNGYSHALGFIPSSSSDYVAPTTYDMLMQLPNAKLESAGKPLSLSMSQSMLTGSTPVKWFHTSTTGTPPVADSSPGSVVYMTQLANAMSAVTSYSYVLITGLVEFKAPITSGDAFGLSCQTMVGGEERKLRIDTLVHESCEYDHPRTGDRPNSAYAGSVPNTPRSTISSGLLRQSYTGEDGSRSNRELLDRPRLVRQ